MTEWWLLAGKQSALQNINARSSTAYSLDDKKRILAKIKSKHEEIEQLVSSCVLPALSCFLPLYIFCHALCSFSLELYQLVRCV